MPGGSGRRSPSRVRKFGVVQESRAAFRHPSPSEGVGRRKAAEQAASVGSGADTAFRLPTPYHPADPLPSPGFVAPSRRANRRQARASSCRRIRPRSAAIRAQNSGERSSPSAPSGSRCLKGRPDLHVRLSVVEDDPVVAVRLLDLAGETKRAVAGGSPRWDPARIPRPLDTPGPPRPTAPLAVPPSRDAWRSEDRRSWTRAVPRKSRPAPDPDGKSPGRS